MKKGLAPAAIGIIVLVCLLVGVNIWQSRSVQSGQDDAASNQQQQQQQPATPPGKPGSADQPVKNLSGVLATSLLPDQTVGDPATAKTKVTIGYIFDTATQIDPSKAAAIVDAVRDWVQQHSGSASLQVMCLDIPPAQMSNPLEAKVPLGVAIDGQQPAGLDKNPGEGTYTAQTILKLLNGS